MIRNLLTPFTLLKAHCNYYAVDWAVQNESVDNAFSVALASEKMMRLAEDTAQTTLRRDSRDRQRISVTFSIHYHGDRLTTSVEMNVTSRIDIDIWSNQCAVLAHILFHSILVSIGLFLPSETVECDAFKQRYHSKHCM